MLHYAGCDGKPFASMINYPIMCVKRFTANFIKFMIRDYLKAFVLEFIFAVFRESLKCEKVKINENNKKVNFKILI